MVQRKNETRFSLKSLKNKVKKDFLLVLEKVGKREVAINGFNITGVILILVGIVLLPIDISFRLIILGVFVLLLWATLK